MVRHATILSVSLFVVCQAFAHTQLKSSAPAANATHNRPVEEIMLEFANAVRLTAVTLSDATGTSKALGAVPKDTAAKFAIEVRETLPDGDYVIAWRAVGADTHVVSGEISFRIVAAARLH